MIRLEVPQELAEELVANQLAIRPGTRSSVAQILVGGASTAATVISLLQAPDTFMRLAAMIKNRFGKHEGVRLQVKGKRGTVDVEVTDQTDVEKLAQMIKEGLVGDID